MLHHVIAFGYGLKVHKDNGNLTDEDCQNFWSLLFNKKKTEKTKTEGVEKNE